MPSSGGWHNWARSSRRSAGSSSCCCPCKLANSITSPTVRSLTATPAHPRHDQGSNAAMCIMLCAVCDHLAITSSVCAANCVFLSPQQKSSCCDLHHNAICSSTGNQCLEQKQDGHKQHVLFDVPVNPGLAGWSTVSPLSPYSWCACDTPSRHLVMPGNM